MSAEIFKKLERLRDERAKVELDPWGNVVDPKKRDDLNQKIQEEMAKVNPETQYEGLTVPGL